MRKIIIIAASIAALAIPAASMAAVTYDGATGGKVDKGDVQKVLELNDAMMQTTRATFTQTGDTAITWAWTCTDGEAYNTAWTMPTSWTVDSKPVLNPNGKIVGWTLDKATNSVATGAISMTGPSPFSCPTGESVASYQDFGTGAYVNTLLYVNGHALPNTPVEISAV
jgi:hypothetical protein